MDRILVVDDESSMRLGLTEVLERAGFTVTAVDGGAAALDALAGQPHALVISDMRMPGMTGTELLATVRVRQPGLPMIMMTAYGTVEDAVAAMKAGAREFLTKPFSPQEVLHVVRGLLEEPEPRTLASTEEGYAAAGTSTADERPIVSRSAAMARVLQVAEAVAGSRAAVLIAGESGTGKELLARTIHDASERKGPFQAINCAALPANLIESELFGYRKGAFTGANQDKPGLVRAAHLGTLFIDEIGDMPLEAQAKLLRLLQEREVLPIGATTAERVDVRVVAATHRDLEAEVAAGRFRGDLLARLREFSVRLPPLRERREDLYPLTLFFLRRAGRGDVAVTLPFMLALAHYGWPYNVRELESAIKLAVALSDGRELDLKHLPESVQEGLRTHGRQGPTTSPGVGGPMLAPPLVAPEPLRAPVPLAKPKPAGPPTEPQLREILARHKGNIAAVGRELGKERMQVHRWLKRYSIDISQYR